MRTAAPVFLLLISLALPCVARDDAYLYRAEMVQAAPGKIVELIDLYKQQARVIEAGGDLSPFWMRHSQGDHWDLLLIYPMKSYAEYYSTARVAQREKAASSARNLIQQIQQDIAWQEDEFIYGPSVEKLAAAFPPAGLFHVEMLRALPGRQADLYKEREMETAYNKALGRPELFIFVRDRGAEWDVISVDVYKDLQDYAGCVPTCAVVTEQKQLEAARAAGYTDPNQIGPHLRSVIATHHDTIAVRVVPASATK